jgi:hypothetical protein
MIEIRDREREIGDSKPRPEIPAPEKWGEK